MKPQPGTESPTPKRSLNRYERNVPVMTRVVATIQARMNSSRLPGKVMRLVEDRPMIAWHVDRLRACTSLSDIVVATTVSDLDQPLVDWCVDNRVSVYRGPEDDVLQRIADALVQAEAEIHVESFGDSPLIDPRLVDTYVMELLEGRGRLDVVSNAIQTTYPPGFEVVVYWSSSLLKLNQIVDPEDPLREHVGSNFARYPHIFHIAAMTAPPEHHFPDMHFEVDAPQDLPIIEAVFREFRRQLPEVSMDDLVHFALQNKALFDFNRGVERRWRTTRHDDIGDHHPHP